jgi:DNA topoisomerase-1
MKPEDVTLEVALRLLSLPKELGPHPENGNPIVAYNGRFGPYIKCGEETRSLPAGLSPIDVTMEQALELLAQPKAMRRGFGAPKEPLKVFDESPVTKQKIQLLEGRYGLYLNDGETNASLPKGLTADALTKEQALELLAARAALGPSKKSAKRKTARKAPAKKKVVAMRDTARGEDGTPEDSGAKPAKKKAVKKKPAKKAVPKKAAKKKSADSE